jgi:hypothetical protein
VLEGIDAKGLQTVEIDLLNVKRGGFHDDLILIVVLKPIGILSVSTIGGPAGGLNIGHPPGFWTQGPKKSGRMESSSPHFHVIGLLDDTPLICPESLQRKDQPLKIHRSSRLSYGTKSIAKGVQKESQME